MHIAVPITCMPTLPAQLLSVSPRRKGGDVEFEPPTNARPCYDELSRIVHAHVAVAGLRRAVQEGNKDALENYVGAIEAPTGKLRRIAIDFNDSGFDDYSNRILLAMMQPSLSQLHFMNCSCLTSVPRRIRLLCKLKDLSLRGCCRLKALPGEICDLARLVVLNLSSCSALENLPDEIGNLTSLKELYLSSCHSLQSLPELGSLTNLTVLDLSNCTSLSNADRERAKGVVRSNKAMANRTVCGTQ